MYYFVVVFVTRSSPSLVWTDWIPGPDCHGLIRTRPVSASGLLSPDHQPPPPPPPPPPPSTHTRVLFVPEIQQVLPSSPCIIASPVTNQWQWYFYWAKSPFVRKMLKFPLQYFWESLKNWFSMYLSELPDLRFKLENFIDGKTKSAILNVSSTRSLWFTSEIVYKINPQLDF